MEQSPYTRKDIEAFVDVALHFVQSGAPYDVARHREAYVRGIERLPPWHQVLLIENRAVSIAGDFDAVNYYYRQLKPEGAARGFFMPGDLKVEFRDATSISGQNLIFWSPASESEAEAQHILAHEDGHRLDWLVGKAGDGDTYLSTQTKALRVALAEELRHREQRRALGQLPPLAVYDEEAGRGVLKWLNDVMIPGPRRDMPAVPQEKLYDDYRDISDHLALYEDKAAHEVEAFAEMMSHHTLLYNQTGGSREKVDETLSQYYPYYWPAFRDHAIPQMERVAGEMIAKRDKLVENYVVDAVNMARIRNVTVDEAALVDDAMTAAARGTLGEDARALHRKVLLYRTPISIAMSAWRDIEEMMWVAQVPEREASQRPYIFNPDDVRQKLKDFLRTAGIDEFVAYAEGLQEQRREIIAFGRAEDLWIRALDRHEIRPGSVQAVEAVARFQALLVEGGLEAVRQYREKLPKPEDVQQYLIARATREEKRTALLQEDVVIAVTGQPAEPDVLEKEIRTLAEAGGADAIRAAAERMAQESAALERYYTRMNTNATTVTRLLGVRAFYYPGVEILAAFDDMYRRGGVDSVDAHTRAITVDPVHVTGYIHAREDIEVARIANLRAAADAPHISQPFGRAIQGPDTRFMEALAQEALSLMGRGDGGKAMAAEIARLRHDLAAPGINADGISPGV